jgi:hypothetical protein
LHGGGVRPPAFDQAMYSQFLMFQYLMGGMGSGASQMAGQSPPNASPMAFLPSPLGGQSFNTNTAAGSASGTVRCVLVMSQPLAPSRLLLHSAPL